MELTKLGLKGADIASASTITPDGRFDRFDVTGTTGITSIHTDGRGTGARFYLRFTGAVTVTHDASNLILASAADVATNAGDLLLFEVIGSNQVRQLAMKGVDHSGITVTDVGPVGPGGNVLVGATISGTAGEGGEASEANDGSDSTCFNPSNSNTATAYWTADRGSDAVEVPLESYVIRTWNDSVNRPVAWVLATSADNSSWTTLDSQTGQSLAYPKQDNTFTATGTLKRYVRFNGFVGLSGVNGIAVTEFKVNAASDDTNTPYEAVTEILVEGAAISEDEPGTVRIGLPVRVPLVSGDSLGTLLGAFNAYGATGDLIGVVPVYDAIS